MIINKLIEISFATNEDRNKIYRIRHEVYASELMQHPQNEGKIFQDKFDDLLAYFIYDNNGKLVGRVVSGTTDPSTYFLKSPMNLKGAAILKSGQYKDAYQLGLHRGKYEALVQRKPVEVIRDNDRNALINYLAPTQTGLYGINIHKAQKGKNNE